MKPIVLVLATTVASFLSFANAQETNKETGPAGDTGGGPATQSTAVSNGESPTGSARDGSAGLRGQVPAAQNIAYPGTLTLKVDLTDLDRRVLSVRESIPVKPGPLTLLYPEWLPGNHAPRGPIDALTGLLLSAGGRRVEWTRDPVNVYAFHLDVPPGATHLDAQFQFASPFLHDQGRTVVTPDIIGLQWNTVVLYPAGYYCSRIPIAPAVTLPEGWEFAAALDVDVRNAGEVSFKPTTLEMLVDSPLFAGHYFKRLDLDPGAAVPVHLNLVADSPESLEVKGPELVAHRKLVQEAYALYGGPHYDRYEFLLALSDHFSEIGLEHHRSSENRRPPGYFTDWDKSGALRDLLPHEYTHSWNGKFRRPAGLATPDFNVPMRDSLLWVYEGLTNYLGYVLAARSGLWSEDFGRQAWASVAANMDRNRAGRAWRDLQDTTDQPIITARRPLSWLSWQRTEDYYTEGQLVWLDVDTKIRELTGDKHSLDDFIRAFYGPQVRGAPVSPAFGPPKTLVGPVTYTFADVVQALNAVARYDWDKYFKDRLHEHASGAPLDGLTRGGWKLVYSQTPSEYTKSVEEERKVFDFLYSLGFDIASQTAQLTQVLWGSPAYTAGLSIGTTLIAIDGREYAPDRLRTAITLAKTTKRPIELLVKNLDRYRTVRINYSDGLQYPQLQRIEKARDRLDAIMKPRT
jgi:predicted metalloprotease with PDZ domain